MDKNNEISVSSTESEIDLHFFVSVIRKSWIWVVIAALFCGIAAGVYTELYVPRRYSSTVVMYVDPTFSTTSTYSAGRAEELAEVYPPILKNADEYAMAVAAAMADLAKGDPDNGRPSIAFPTDWSTANAWKSVRSHMTTGVQDDRLFYITMTSTDPGEAYYLTLCASAAAKKTLNEYVKQAEVRPLKDPQTPTAPISPNLKKNILIAAVAGAAVCFVAFFLYYLFDTTIYTEEELRKFSMPILGCIPSIPDLDEKKSLELLKKGGKS